MSEASIVGRRRAARARVMGRGRPPRDDVRGVIFVAISLLVLRSVLSSPFSLPSTAEREAKRELRLERAPSKGPVVLSAGPPPPQTTVSQVFMLFAQYTAGSVVQWS